MGFRPASEGAGANPEELRKALAGMPAAPSQDDGGDDEDDADDSAGGETIGSRYAAIADRLGSASLPDRGSGPAATYVGPAPGPMKSVDPGSLGDNSAPKPDAALGGDQLSSGAAGSSGSKIPMLTADQLQSARDEKRDLGLYGALADNLANRQSFGNFFLGHMNPHQDASAVFRQQQGLVDQGLKDTQTLQSQALKAPEMQYMQDLQDPNSDASKSKRAEAQMGVQALVQAKLLDPEKAQGLIGSLDKMNGFQASKMTEGNPLLKQAADVMKSQATLAMAGRRLDQADDRFKYKQTSDANKVAETDPDLQSNDQRLKGVARIQDLLSAVKSGKIVTNAQVKGQLEEEVARLEQNARNLALGHVERQSSQTGAADMGKMLEYFTGDPQAAITPSQMKQLGGLLDSMSDAYKRQYDDRISFLKRGRSAEQQDIIEQKTAPQRQSFSNSLGGWRDGGASSQPGFSDDDKKLLEWAKQNPNDPDARAALVELDKKAKKMKGAPNG